MDNIDKENFWPIMEVVDGLLNGVVFMNVEVWQCVKTTNDAEDVSHTI